MPFKILSIDGGGSRGAATAQFLWHLETELGRPLHQEFDLIIGTSIGGLLAIAFGVLHLPARDVLELFSAENVARLFGNESCWDRWLDLAQLQPKYTGEGKTEFITRLVGERNRHLGCARQEKPVVSVPVWNMLRNQLELYSTHEEPHVPTPTLVDLADACSAAPAYFPHRDFDMISADGEHTRRCRGIDAGVDMNNPILLGCAHLCDLELQAGRPNPPLSEFHVLSVGTGEWERPPEVDLREAGGVQWITSGVLLEVAMDQGALNKVATSLLPHLLRVNSPLPSHMALDTRDPRDLATLKEMGKQWWHQYKTQTLNLLKKE